MSKIEFKKGIEGFLDIIEALRHPETGCPWDLKQTPQTLTPYVLEEAYEVVDAIETKSVSDIKEELGDLLLQIVLQAQIAKEQNQFTFDDIVDGISQKMIRRHPHVFGDLKLESDEDVREHWEKLKEAEKEKKDTVLSNISTAQPAIQEILKIQKKLSKLHFDFEDVSQAFEKSQEELDELSEAICESNSDSILEELGDCFAALINVARISKIDPDLALRNVARKYRIRAERMFIETKKDHVEMKDLSREEKLAYWKKAKISQKTSENSVKKP